MLANLLYHRLDILLGCLLVTALALEERRASRLAGLILGASVAFKVIPILLVPAWVAWKLRSSLKEALSVSLSVILGAGGPMLAAYLLWGKEAIFFLGEHGARGIQIESAWATVELLLMELGLEGKTYFSAGSHNLSTALEPAFTKGSHIVGAAAGLWGALIAFRLARRQGPLVLAVSGTLGACLLASKVFSPQFLLFFLPVLALSFDSLRPSVRRLAMGLTVLSCGLTTWVYPYHEEELVALSAVATVPLMARNAAFALLVVLLQVHAWRAGGSRRTADRAAGTAS